MHAATGITSPLPRGSVPRPKGRGRTNQYLWEKNLARDRARHSSPAIAAMKGIRHVLAQSFNIRKRFMPKVDPFRMQITGPNKADSY